MINWPASLVDALAEKRAIIFLGAGISASALSTKNTSPPTWTKLLYDASNEFIKIQKDKTLVDKMIKNGQLLDAAEVIFEKVGKPERRIFLSAQFAEPDYKPSEFHEAIRDIDAKIVITTNYDQIYEDCCGALKAGHGYSVRTHRSDNLLNDIRSKDNVIIKAHGCINDIENIVLLRSDYFRIKKDCSYFYHIMNSLVTINTVLFIGCGMNDPDIQIVLENMNISAYSEHPHYAVLPQGKHSAINAAMERSFNIKVLEYKNKDGGSHEELLESLKSLSMQVSNVRYPAAASTPI